MTANTFIICSHYQTKSILYNYVKKEVDCKMNPSNKVVTNVLSVSLSSERYILIK